jgi:hypothetical protein
MKFSKQNEEWVSTHLITFIILFTFFSTHFLFVTPQALLGKCLLFIEFSLSHSGTQHSRTLLSELLVQRRELEMATHNTYKRDIHDFDGIRTCNPSKPTAADPSLKRRCHQCSYYSQWKFADNNRKFGKNFIKIVSLIVLQIWSQHSLPHPLQFILGSVKKLVYSPE